MAQRVLGILTVLISTGLFCAPAVDVEYRGTGVSFDTLPNPHVVSSDSLSEVGFTNAELISPVPRRYIKWARTTLKCLDRKERDTYSTNVKFMVVDSLMYKGEPQLGLHSPGNPDLIFLERAHKYDQRVVRHEIVHAVCPECEHDVDGVTILCTGF